MKYLVDANILIGSKNYYYPMDIMPKFWELLATKIQDGTIVILDKVRDEIIGHGTDADELETWLTGLQFTVQKSSTDEIRNAYAELMRDLGSSPFYTRRALTSWSVQKVADPWIVATAKVHGFTVVTQEKAGQESADNKTSRPKIPNFTSRYGIRTIDLTTLIRELGFSWR